MWGLVVKEFVFLVGHFIVFIVFDFFLVLVLYELLMLSICKYGLDNI